MPAHDPPRPAPGNRHTPYRSTGITHAGTVRAANQDAFVERPAIGLWAVADGAGGHQSGEIASMALAAALQAIPPGLAPREAILAVRQQIEATHQDLLARGAAAGPDTIMATTIVAILAQDDHFACLWAGDSRAYLLRAGTLTRISRDHSLVEELVEAGTLTPAAAEHHPHANVITRAVGANAGVLDVEKRTGTLLPGDHLLLCSDGLTKALPEPRIASLIPGGATALLDAALAAHATDNVTAVVIAVGP